MKISNYKYNDITFDDLFEEKQINLFNDNISSKYSTEQSDKIVQLTADILQYTSDILYFFIYSCFSFELQIKNIPESFLSDIKSYCAKEKTILQKLCNTLTPESFFTKVMEENYKDFKRYLSHMQYTNGLKEECEKIFKGKYFNPSKSLPTPTQEMSFSGIRGLARNFVHNQLGGHYTLFWFFFSDFAQLAKKREMALNELQNLWDDENGKSFCYCMSNLAQEPYTVQSNKSFNMSFFEEFYHSYLNMISLAEIDPLNECKFNRKKENYEIKSFDIKPDCPQNILKTIIDNINLTTKLNKDSIIIAKGYLENIKRNSPQELKKANDLIEPILKHLEISNNTSLNRNLQKIISTNYDIEEGLDITNVDYNNNLYEEIITCPPDQLTNLLHKKILFYSNATSRTKFLKQDSALKLLSNEVEQIYTNNHNDTIKILYRLLVTTHTHANELQKSKKQEPILLIS